MVPVLRRKADQKWQSREEWADVKACLPPRVLVMSMFELQPRSESMSGSMVLLKPGSVLISMAPIANKDNQDTAMLESGFYGADRAMRI